MSEFTESVLAKAAKGLKPRLTSKEQGVAKEIAVDPVQALDNFITRLGTSGDEEIQRHGKALKEHLERRLREYKTASAKNPGLTINEWVTQLTAARTGDVMAGYEWDLGKTTGDFKKKPGQFSGNWRLHQITEILGDLKSERLINTITSFNPNRAKHFRFNVQGSYGVDSQGTEDASYEEKGIRVTKPGEREAEISILLKVETPPVEYGKNYSEPGAILGLAIEIQSRTLEAYLQKGITSPPVPAAAHR